MNADDQRQPGEAFCSDCPDHEGCMQGYPCWLVKKTEREYQERKANDVVQHL